MRLRLLLTCWFLGGMLSQVFSQKVIALESLKKVYKIGKETYYFKDESNALTIKDVTEPEFQSKFTLSDSDELNFSYSPATYWLRFQVKISEDFVKYEKHIQANDWLLEISYPLLDYTDFYYWDYEEWQVKKAGDMYPYQFREMKHRFHVFTLDQPNNLVQTYYLKVKTQSPFNIPLKIYRASAFFDQNAQVQLGYGLFVGIILFVILNSFIIYLAIREIGYINYIFYSMVVLVFNLVLSGHLLQYFFTEYGGWQNSFLLILFVISIAMSAFYAHEFLEVKKYSASIRRLLLVWMIVSLALLPCVFLLPYRTMSMLGQLGSLVTLIMVLIVGMLIWKKGNISARYYVLAHILYFILVLPPILKNYAILPSNFFTIHGVEFGKLNEIIFLSFALADRTRMERKRAYQEKEQAQKEIIRVQKDANETLEKKVEERTKQLQEAYEELQASEEELRQNSEILAYTNANLRAAQDELRLAFEQIDQKNKDITSSINYASRIQSALLPLEDEIQNYLSEYFILFRPRDIVSGDIYWFGKAGGKLFLSAIDCTGHGVPGAFMSMIADSILHQLIVEKGIYSADVILNEMHKSIRKALKQDISENKDGMDLAFCVIDREKKTLEFAGAHNPLIVIQNGELKIIKGNNFSIGGFQHEENRVFDKNIIDLSIPTTFYIFTDGYQDQFGGEDKRKFLPSRFRELLLEICDKPIKEQRQLMEQALESWMGDQKQIDDILVIGVKV